MLFYLLNLALPVLSLALLARFLSIFTPVLFAQIIVAILMCECYMHGFKALRIDMKSLIILLPLMLCDPVLFGFG